VIAGRFSFSPTGKGQRRGLHHVRHGEAEDRPQRMINVQAEPVIAAARPSETSPGPSLDQNPLKSSAPATTSGSTADKGIVEVTKKEEG